MKKIPLFRPNINRKEFKAVENVLKSKQLSRGPCVEFFEQEFAKFVGRRFAIAVNGGTSGLDICMKALGIKKGDKVITSAYSFIASANCILYQGAKPVFCDVDSHNGLIDTNKLRQIISGKIKAFLPVDIFGQQYDLSELKKSDLPIIVDSCESFGVPPQAGALANVYGFYPNKQITTGEGGMIVTDDEQFADKLRSLRNQGFKKTKNYLTEIDIGFNFRMSDINAALGLAQLQNAKKILRKRWKLAHIYSKLLNDIPEVEFVLNMKNTNISIFNIPVICKNRHIRNCIVQEFEKHQIEYSFGFPPLTHFAYIQKATGYKPTDFPNTEIFAQNLLCLPMFTDMSTKQVRFIVKHVKQGIHNAEN
ncbi:MAG: DegT/DnrJ/EryC1/StrS aminotransferase family protein [Alphaproteobacteria bacterium]|nr:DegT/DnrJ/EryC1/StrS aminotransferase family protein [Alphaproteobacteria bacterium]